MFFVFTFETKNGDRRAIGSMGGFPWFEEGVGQRRIFFLARPSQKIYMPLGTSRVIWSDLGAFLSDFSNFRMQNHCVV